MCGAVLQIHRGREMPKNNDKPDSGPQDRRNKVKAAIRRGCNAAVQKSRDKKPVRADNVPLDASDRELFGIK
jgi:hypothetical protein